MTVPLDSRHTQGFGTSAPLRSAAETRELQLKVRALVDDSLTEYEQRAELRELLLMLDLLRPAASAPMRGSIGPACAEDMGTLRGYRRHVAAYSTPCNPCLNARMEELRDHWRALGIEHTDIVTHA